MPTTQSNTRGYARGEHALKKFEKKHIEKNIESCAIERKASFDRVIW
jgi:hypothetical protein